jgi:alpha-beta hydrolase superfamily lysophospholipase
MVVVRRPAILAALAAILLPAAAASQPVKLVAESYHVPARDAGIQLFVRNKRPESMTAFTSDRIVLFVHGVTYPAESTFDLPIGDASWMDYIASRGYDVYLMDVRGYGRSTRPREMERPPKENAPIVNTEVAIADFGTVVDHILARRTVSRINVMGWSWGTVIAGAYAARHSAKIESLVLYAPLWVRQNPGGLRLDGSAYRMVTMEGARQRWLAGVPADRQKELIPAGVFEAWWKANMEADPVGAKQTPPVVRAPNGALADGLRTWEADTRYYDPSTITVPTLLVVGEWDVDTPPSMAQALLARLTGAPARRLVIIGEATHTMLLERNRLQLYREVQTFLEEPTRVSPD